METNLRPQSVESIPQSRYLQDGNPGNNPAIFTKGGMGDFARLQRRIFPQSYQSKVTKIPEVLPEQSNLSVHSSSLWVGHSSLAIYKGDQRSETDGAGKGYPDPSVPRRLVAESPLSGDLPTTYPDHLEPMPQPGLGSKYGEVGTHCSAGLQFRWLPVRPVDRLGLTHSGPVDNPSAEMKVHQGPEQLRSQTVHVFNRTTYSNRETGMVRSPSYETHSVASEVTLARTRQSRKGHSIAPQSPSTPSLVVK